jgi:dipeptidyl aminopeptidase/acylaminoacyl peptidase
MNKRLFYILFWSLVLLLSAAFAQVPKNAKVLTPEMVVSLKEVKEVTLDASAQYVAYTLRVPRSKVDKPGADYSEIWVVSTKGGEPRQYTSAPVNASAPQWSPNGKFIAFLSTRKEFDEDREIYLIPRDGGEAKQLSHAESSVQQFRWSPDGKWIAYVAPDPKTSKEISAEKAGRDWRVADQKYKHRRLWKIEVATGKTQKLVTANLSVWSFNWSPDGKKLVFQATETPKTDDSYMFKKIYTISAEGGKPTLLCSTEGKLGNMAWSPDGKFIAFLGAVDIHDPANGSVFLVPATGGEARNLTPNLKGTANHVEWVNPTTLAFSAIEGTKTTLNLLSLKTNKIEKVGSNGAIFYDFHLSKDGKSFVYAANTASHPNEVFFGSLRGKGFSRLTDSNPDLKKIPLAKQETISWKSTDGLEIQGVLWKPLHYQASRTYPLIVQVHGGPESAYLDGWQTSYSRWAQLLAARGYFFLMPNYRGSIGRGVAYSKADQDDHGGKEFEDVLAGIDYLAEQGLVDPEQVGIGGGSYGGFLSAWAATRYSERFKAAVDFAGVTNWISKSGTSDIPYENALVHWTSWWWEQPDLVWERSPMAHIKNAKTPTLIAHGSNDKRVPVGQAWELYRGLKHMGVPTELVIYPREPHGLRERAHKLDYLDRVLNWFDRYVKGEGTN